MKGEGGGVHEEGGDKVHGEHQEVEGEEFQDGWEDVSRIQRDVWSLSAPRTELKRQKMSQFKYVKLVKIEDNISFDIFPFSTLSMIFPPVSLRGTLTS